MAMNRKWQPPGGAHEMLRSVWQPPQRDSTTLSSSQNSVATQERRAQAPTSQQARRQNRQRPQHLRPTSPLRQRRNVNFYMPASCSDIYANAVMLVVLLKQHFYCLMNLLGLRYCCDNLFYLLFVYWFVHFCRKRRCAPTGNKSAIFVLETQPPN